ncbi:MAG: PPOX class F420-dependent oxidoreductase [Candidatus Lokiarchaeota archaeon]|nr:PPOX class F420-dependent oxidoreductase [Candidatus Lokiarchaeota archaeon]
MAESIPKQNLSTLLKKKYINLTTYRKNGEGVSTPVIFAEKNDKIYVETQSTTYKVARIKNNPKVKIAPCNMIGKGVGQYLEGKVRILSNLEQDVAIEALKKKYFRYRIRDKIKGKKSQEEDIYLEIILEI